MYLRYVIQITEMLKDVKNDINYHEKQKVSISTQQMILFHIDLHSLIFLAIQLIESAGKREISHSSSKSKPKPLSITKFVRLDLRLPTLGSI